MPHSCRWGRVAWVRNPPDLLRSLRPGRAASIHTSSSGETRNGHSGKCFECPLQCRLLRLAAKCFPRIASGSEGLLRPEVRRDEPCEYPDRSTLLRNPKGLPEKR